MAEFKVEKIYFDMDGVLADFNKGVLDFCGMEAPSLSGPDNPELDDEMWKRIRETEHFYYKLDFMPGAKEMFDALYKKYGNRCEILTGIPKEKRGITTAAKDKENWIHDFLYPEIKVNCVLRADKKGYGGSEGCILIDDMEKNIKEWEAKGGTGIRNVSAEDTIKKLKEMGILD